MAFPVVWQAVDREAEACRSRSVRSFASEADPSPSPAQERVADPFAFLDDSRFPRWSFFVPRSTRRH